MRSDGQDPQTPPPAPRDWRGLRPSPPAAGRQPIVVGAGRRASMAGADFRRDVVGHLIHTCARELRDASAVDYYTALAHTVRDRLVHRWLATQRTHFERDVKRACYFSSEFLTGRSL